MSGTKGNNEEEDELATVGSYHGYPLLIKTDMRQDMVLDVSVWRYF